MKKLLTIAVSAALMTSAVANADIRSTANENSNDMAEQASEKMVSLMVKRDSLEAQGRFPWERVRVPASEVEARHAELLSDPDVAAIERSGKAVIPQPEYPKARVMSVFDDPLPAPVIDYPLLYNDPQFENQRIFHETAGYSMKLTQALRRLEGSNNTVRVGILDTGFVTSNDVQYQDGYNFAGASGSEFRHDGALCDPTSFVSYHGAWVSSILGATPHNGLGIAGVTPNADLVAGRVGDCHGSVDLADVATGIRWLSGEVVAGPNYTIPPVDVINISVSTTGGSVCPTYMQDAINVATNKGISVVIAAGNSMTDASRITPGNCDNVITVAATTHDGKPSSFTNAGSVVDISATGSSVLTLSNNDEVIQVSGTSFAAPIVAATIGLAKSKYNELSLQDIQRALSNSGQKLNPESLYTEGLGSGILDAMLLLDNLGVPREVVPAINGLSGEREQYKTALLHPEAQAFLGNKNLCQMVEIDGRTMDEADKTQPLILFKVAKGAALLPTKGTIIDQVAGQDRFFTNAITASEANAFDFGIAQCDVATGIDCTQKASIRGIDSESLIATNECDAI